MKYNEKEFMNIIKVNKDDIHMEKEDNKLKVSLSDKLDFYDIMKLNIDVFKDTSLFISYEGKDEIKLDISITLAPNVTLKLYELKESKEAKIQEKFYIYDNSKVISEKFIHMNSLKELNIIYLNGVGSEFTSHQTGIIKDKSKLDVLSYHNYPKTSSYLNHNFVTIEDGEMKLNVTSMVYKNRKKSMLRQNNRILNQNNSASYIKPNLLIEENDIEASHSANIEPFNQKMIFYMQTRGIAKKEAEKLLLTDFLKNNVVDITKYIKKYWR